MVAFKVPLSFKLACEVSVSASWTVNIFSLASLNLEVQVRRKSLRDLLVAI